MGQTLGVAAEWTSAKESSKGKLEYTPKNEVILNKVITFVENFSGINSAECEIEFKQPLVWETQLKPDDFSGDFNTT